MREREVQIRSYFSLPTDLAAEFSDWPEFVSGKHYDVELRSTDSRDSVSVGFVASEDTYVFVRSTGDGDLFYRVLGVVCYALAAHSDDIMLDRLS